MLAVIGVCILCLNVVVFISIYKLVRRPSPPAWTQNDFLVQMVTIAWVGCLAFAAGLVGKSINDFAVSPLTAANYAEIAAAVVGAYLLAKLVGRTSAQSSSTST